MQGARPTTPPFVATLLTWFLPGAGHLAVGAPAVALLGFLVVQGLYLLGFALSGGQAFEFLDWELRGTLALVLTPEVGNLGALVAHQMVQPLGSPGVAPPVPPSTVHLGSALTCASGVLNLALMAHVHLVARLGRTADVDRTALQVAAGWAVPGLGHLLQGRRLRAVLVAATVLSLFVAGTALCGGTNLGRDHHFYYWSGQVLLGLPAFAAEALFGHGAPGEVPRFLDEGIFFASLGGILNGLVLIDVYAFGESRALGLDPVEDRRSMAEHRRQAKARGRSARKERGDDSAPASKHLVAPRAPGAEGSAADPATGGGER